MHVAVSLVPTTLAGELSRFGDAPFTYVVVDVLRASTVICTALANGATALRPFADIDSAKAARAGDWSDALLCGERTGRKIQGFDLGNSPSEYTTDRIGGRKLIFASTNGSVALASAPPEAEVLVGGLVNLSAVAKAIAEIDRTTIIACSGKLGRFSLEDTLGAGAIIAKLWEAAPDLELAGDGAQAAQLVWDRYKSDPTMALWQSEHGKYLIEIGFGSDLSICSSVDSVPVVPRWHHSQLEADGPA